MKKIGSLKSYKKVLVIQTAFLGDVILTTSLLKAIKDENPNIQTGILVIPQVKDILLNNPNIDKIITYDKKDKEKGIKGLFNIIKKLNLFSPEIIISPHRSLRTGIIVLSTKSKIKIGFKNSSLSFVYDHLIEHQKGVHEITRLLKLLTPFGINIEYINPEIYLKKEEIASGEEMLKYAFGTKENICAFAPGSVWGTKRWPREYYKELAKMLAKDGYKVAIVGGKEDHPLGEFIAQDIENVHNFCGLKLRESAAIIKHSRFMVSNDTAPMHIAIALGVYVFSIFGATHPKLGFAPYNENIGKVIQIELPCRPCSSHGPKKCPKKHFKCMRDIYPQMVYKEIKSKYGGI